jgi:hypothetical protein
VLSRIRPNPGDVLSGRARSSNGSLPSASVGVEGLDRGAERRGAGTESFALDSGELLRPPEGCVESFGADTGGGGTEGAGAAIFRRTGRRAGLGGRPES